MSRMKFSLIFLIWKAHSLGNEEKLPEITKKNSFSFENPNYEKSTSEKNVVGEMVLEISTNNKNKFLGFRKEIFIKILVFLLFCIFFIVSICTHSLIQIDGLKVTNNSTTNRTTLNFNKYF